MSNETVYMVGRLTDSDIESCLQALSKERNITIANVSTAGGPSVAATVGTLAGSSEWATLVAHGGEIINTFHVRVPGVDAKGRTRREASGS